MSAYDPKQTFCAFGISGLLRSAEGYPDARDCACIFGIAGRVVVSVIRQLVAGDVPEHVRVYAEG